MGTMVMARISAVQVRLELRVDQLCGAGRGSDWAAYLTREGQSARLEAWREGCNDEEDNDMVREEDEDE